MKLNSKEKLDQWKFRLRIGLGTLTTVAVCFSLLLFCAVMVCDSYYFYRSDDNPTNGFCLPLYRRLFPEHKHKGYPMWPSTVVLTVLLVVLPCFILLFPVSVIPAKKKRRNNGISLLVSRREKLRVVLTKGDPIIWIWAMILIVIPMVIVLLVVGQKEVKNATGIKLIHVKFANPAGYLATIALALFMVPVAKQSPLLAAIGWSPIQALGIHIWAGRACWIMTLLHGGLYVIDYGRKNDDDNGFWYNVWSGLVPGVGDGCWSFQSIRSFRSGSHCYRPWRNFTGLISAFALIMLITTSWNSIRRWNYRFFYVSHILFGSIMIVFAIFHFYWIALYITPGLIYYMACTYPIVVQHAASYFIDGGTLLKKTRLLGNSNGCMELTFARSSSMMKQQRSTNSSSSSIVPGAYVRICVPEISMMWHPFTVPHTVINNTDDNTTNEDEELKLLIRRYGYFTKTLYNRLSSQQQQHKSPPTVLVDGYYQGADWFASALEHDSILMVSGGIGVTPMIPLLQLLHQHMTMAAATTTMDEVRTKFVSFHWYCRDEGLIRHVVNEYLAPLLKDVVIKENDSDDGDDDDDDNEESSSLCHFKIIIHNTGRDFDSTEPFTLYGGGSDEETPANNTDDGEDVEPCFHDEPEEIAKEPSNDIVLNYNNKDSRAGGKPMEPASFSYLSSSSNGRWIGFSIYFGTTYFIYLYWYITEVREHTSRVFFRGYSLYAMIFIILLGAIITEACKRTKLFNRRSEIILLDDDNDDDHHHHSDIDDAEIITKYPSSSSSLSFPMEGRLSGNSSNNNNNNNSSTVYFDISNGRPFMNDVIHPIVEAELPGAFYCGPQVLLRAVQNEIKSERTRVHGRRMGATKCCTYQEHFEM